MHFTITEEWGLGENSLNFMNGVNKKATANTTIANNKSFVLGARSKLKQDSLTTTAIQSNAESLCHRNKIRKKSPIA